MEPELEPEMHTRKDARCRRMARHVQALLSLAGKRATSHKLEGNMCVAYPIQWSGKLISCLPNTSKKVVHFWAGKV